MFGIGWNELVVFFLIILLLFGGAKLPELARSLGTSINEFRESLKGEDKRKEKDREKDKDKEE